MVYPLDSSLCYSFGVYLENDTIRPDLYIEKVSSETEDSLPVLVRLFNHVLYTKDKNGRHKELLVSLEDFLTKKHFVQIVPGQPLVLTNECFIDMLPDENLDNILSRLGYKDLLEFSKTCMKFEGLGLARLARNSKYLNKYVSNALVTEGFILPKSPYDFFNARYNLDLPKFISLAVFKICPLVQTLKILEAKTSIKSMQAVLQALPNLQGLLLGNLECLTEVNIPTIEFPAGLKRCTLWGRTSDTTIATLARRSLGLNELVVCCAKDLTPKAFSGKTPFKDLTKLHLYSVNYSEATLRHIFLCSPKIENLHLNSCNAFTGSSLVHLRFLKELNASITSFTGAHFKTAMQNAPSLTTLDVSFCEGITSEDFEQVKYPKTLREFTGHWTDMNYNGLQNLILTTALDSLQLTSCVRLTEEVFEEHPELLAHPNYDFGIKQD